MLKGVWEAGYRAFRNSSVMKGIHSNTIGIALAFVALKSLQCFFTGHMAFPFTSLFQHYGLLLSTYVRAPSEGVKSYLTQGPDNVDRQKEPF